MMRKEKRLQTFRSKIENWFYIYRYDMFAIALVLLGILYYASILFQPGHVVFSDIDFPFFSQDYMDEVYGLWNTRWNTVSMLNIPRLFFILPLYVLSGVFKWNGHLFLKGFIMELMFLSGISMYLLSKRLVSVYTGAAFNLWKVNALIFGSLLYALNPWMIYRIQHIYLLTGYSLFPLVILYFFKVFDHKFQKQFIQEYSPYSSHIYKRNVIDILILAYLITMSSAAIHYFFYSVLVLGLLYALLCAKYLGLYIRKGKIVLKHVFQAILKKTVILALIIFGLSFYWLSIYVGGILLDVGASQHNINVIDTYTMFSRHASLSQVLLLMGYWWPMVDLSALPTMFYIGGSVLLCIIFIGVVFNAHKYHIVLFFTILAAGLTLLSTGVYYPAVSGLFLKLAGLPAFGNIFRDPNKMIGLTAISYSVLLVFGLETIYAWTSKSRRKQYLNSAVFILLIISCAAYLVPVRQVYFERFYQPIEEPQAYKALREYYKENPSVSGSGDEPYALYVPIAEHMLRPVVHISTPKWNVPEGYENVKATGDIHIYNSPIDTVFHHEGNDPSIKFMYDMIQFMLDKGRSTHIDELVRIFGVNQLIYHDEYLEQEARQSFNESILEVQDDLELEYANSIFSVYNIPIQKEMANFNHRRFITPYGLIKLNSLTSIPGYDPLETPVIFMSKEESFDKRIIGQDDIIEAKNINDLILASLSTEYRLYPFDYVHEVNPFTKWAKSYTSFSDWAWIQTKLDVIHPSFEWDHNKGLVMTFASEAFDVLPHKRKLIEGEVIYDFDSLLKADKFFTADNPDLFEVISNPYNISDNLGVLHGVIQQGDPSFIWQVAKSPVLIAEEKMPYQFKILLSGRGANKLHMKARFYDKNKHEIGIQYIVGPDEFVNFDTIEFTGEVVSPKDTAFIRIDLLTYQRPDEKIYWWIHDVEIKKFPKYTKANSIEMIANTTPDTYRVFVKSFDSVGGGEYSVSVDGMESVISTRSSQLSGFKWHDLGSYDVDENELSILLTNLTGFNAIQHIVTVPKKVYDNEYSSWERILQTHDFMLNMETEIDFDKNGNIQSRRVYPELSYGTGTAVSAGTIEAEFEIIAPGVFDIKPEIYFSDAVKGAVKLNVADESGRIIYSKELKERMSSENEETITIDFDPLERIYPYEIIDKARPYQYSNSQYADGIALKKGRYRIIMEIESENANYAALNTFHSFDPDSIITESVRRDQAIQDCSTCESITPDMMRHYYTGDRSLTIEYDETCSCDWYISSSHPIDVESNDELLVTFEARSDAIEKRHSKLVFLDKYDQVLETAFVFEVEEQEKAKWNRYEQLVKVPEGAEKVLYQFWARGHKSLAGRLELRNFKLEKYQEFILVDKVVLKSSGLETAINDLEPQLQEGWRSEMKFSHKVLGNTNERTVWNSFLSPHKIWKVNDGSSDMTLNGVTMGFPVRSRTLNGRMTLGRVYQFGLLLHGATIIVTIAVYLVMKRKGLL